MRVGDSFFVKFYRILHDFTLKEQTMNKKSEKPSKINPFLTNLFAIFPILYCTILFILIY
jgi:hypothetical protein